MSQPATQKRLVYLAHASEDKAIVKPFAEHLLRRGIDVWYDNWEIGFGDSLRRKMEQGLGDCTHFVVILTATSIKKPWVQEEIDAALVRTVEGSARFIGLRHELEVSELSPFLRGRFAPEFLLSDQSYEELVAQIYGVSRKPALGEAPKYVHAHEPGSSWSASAKVVAEYFVRNTEHAGSMDPQTDHAAIQAETGLPMPDVRIGVLDLQGAGLLEKQDYIGGDSLIYAKPALFTVFDAFSTDWNPEQDARALAIHLMNLKSMGADCEEVAKDLVWEPRRFNPAVAYLVDAKVVESEEYMGSGHHYWPPAVRFGDELLRFVRSL